MRDLKKRKKVNHHLIIGSMYKTLLTKFKKNIYIFSIFLRQLGSNLAPKINFPNPNCLLPLYWNHVDVADKSIFKNLWFYKSFPNYFDSSLDELRRIDVKTLLSFLKLTLKLDDCQIRLRQSFIAFLSEKYLQLFITISFLTKMGFTNRMRCKMLQ